MPKMLRHAYDRLAKALRSFNGISECVYIYPFEFTHITIATLVSFKNHENPNSAEKSEILRLANEASRRFEHGRHYSSDIPHMPFVVDIGNPILAPEGAFLPILNATAEVAGIRKWARANLSDLLGQDFHIPSQIHSTILRFTRIPDMERNEFIRLFQDIASEFVFGEVAMDAILITLEEKPYMRSGQILYKCMLPGSVKHG